MSNPGAASNMTILDAVHNLQTQGILTYTSFSDNWVIKIVADKRVHFISGFALDLNSQAASSIAKDKVATYQLLADSGVPAVPHFLVTHLVSPEPDLQLLQSLYSKYGSLVIKPAQGSGGRYVNRCDTLDEALVIARDSKIPSWAASPRLNLCLETRYVVTHGGIALAYEKYDPPVMRGLRMFNLGLGAMARRIEPATIDHETQELARATMQATGLKLGAVDVVQLADGSRQVLEVNASFSLEHFANLLPTNYQKVVAFYEHVITDLVQQQQ